MSTLKAFGISCGVVLCFCGVVGLLVLLAEWQPWLFISAILVIMVGAGTVMLKGLS